VHVPPISWSDVFQGGAHGDHHQTCLRHQPGGGQLHLRVRGEHGLVGRQSEADALGDQVGQREVPCLGAATATTWGEFWWKTWGYSHQFGFEVICIWVIQVVKQNCQVPLLDSL